MDVVLRDVVVALTTVELLELLTLVVEFSELPDVLDSLVVERLVLVALELSEVLDRLVVVALATVELELELVA